ncbi:MAG: FeoB-associated Cys-rich membrane protein [Clostridiaceae bacterium]
MNLPTILVASAVAAVFIWIIAASIRNKKKGKPSCSCGSACAGCAMEGSCHSKT